MDMPTVENMERWARQRKQFNTGVTHSLTLYHESRFKRISSYSYKKIKENIVLLLNIIVVATKFIK